MTRRDRLVNRYLINFVDHRSKYCRVFQRCFAKKTKHFFVAFGRRFNYCIHVLRTDGKGSYKPLDAFCKESGVFRQVSERSNQASNGKAERMHRAIMNMVPGLRHASPRYGA